MTASVALLRAYEELTNELNDGIGRYEQTGRFTNVTIIRRCVERFVDAFSGVPAASEELRRRAEYVETACRKDSKYDKLKADALKSCRLRPKKQTEAGLVLAKLRAFEDYSENCENRNEKDAALHRYLWRCAAQARTLFESALERVVEHEGLDIKPDLV